MTDDEKGHLDAVELRLARCQDELRRVRLEQVRVWSLTRNALTAIHGGDLPGAAYDLSLAQSLGRGEQLQE